MTAYSAPYRPVPGRSALPDPATLQGQLVRWPVRDARGRRGGYNYATVRAYLPIAPEADGGPAFVLEVPNRAQSPWSPAASHLRTIPLRGNGPFEAVERR